MVFILANKLILLYHINYQTKMEKLDQEAKIINPVSTGREPEFDQQKIEWGQSIFSDEKISDYLADIIERMREYDEYLEKNVLKELNRIHEGVAEHLDILETAMRQSESEEIRERALKILFCLARTAFLTDINLRPRLNELILRNIDIAIAIVENNTPQRNYAKLILAFYYDISTKDEPREDVPKVSGEFSEKTRLALHKYLETISKEGVFNRDDIMIFDILLSRGDLSEVKESIYSLMRYVYDVHDYEVILACLNSKSDWLVEGGRIAIIRVLQQYNFSEDTINKMIDEWLFGGGSEFYIPIAVEKNIKMMKSIEEKRPGIVQFLMSKFNIYNFGRYPEELLIRQYDEYENDELPYGIVIFPEDDHNAAFFENGDVLEEIENELKDKYAMRIMEAGNKKDLLRLLIRMRLKYGQKHKISYAIVGGHGNKKELTIGNVHDTEGREVLIEDLTRYQKRKYKLFEDNATIILIACNTGEPGGIGSQLSKAMGINVIAPSGISGVKSIKPKIKSNGSLEFDVKYTNRSKGAKFKPE